MYTHLLSSNFNIEFPVRMVDPEILEYMNITCIFWEVKLCIRKIGSILHPSSVSSIQPIELILLVERVSVSQQGWSKIWIRISWQDHLYSVNLEYIQYTSSTLQYVNCILLYNIFLQNTITKNTYNTHTVTLIYKVYSFIK